MALQNYGNSNYQNRNQSNGFDNRTQQGTGGYQQEESAAERTFKELKYNPEWIKKEADEDLIQFAEKAGKFMVKNGLTNSKIRSIYGEIKRIQMSTFEKEKSAFILLKPKVAYAFGREEKNKNGGLHLFKLIFDRCSQDVSDQKSYQNFCNFMEAILAYHKANGGN
ncbi:MAG: type III-A CRISPR-associated protein Csm2 [Candidatus Azobacteroides sp.]|nr:type III-A CRISPR-associated protein Csm2 [Candidatus Azobacteroides sp.]